MAEANQVTVLNNRYQLGQELGRGGMGVVYRARDPTLDRDVAVKVLSDLGLGTEGRARLLHEAQAVAKLSHPNIVPVFDAGESDGSPFIVMEMIDGRSLHDQPPKDLADIVQIAGQICAALDHAHTQGIVHRDLKPENVLIDSEGTAKLMDFGIARSMATRLTSGGMVVGTVFYLAPEIALGHDYDGRADLYSLGVMLYELTTGSLPFADGDPVSVISQHIHTSVVPPRAKNPDIPPSLDTLIVQLMSKDPDSRPATASETLRLLRRKDLLNPDVPEEKEILVLDRIVRGRFIGREQELAEARSLWNKAEGGEGQTLLISGEPGIGKTRLMRELSTHVEVSRGRALIGACYAEGGAPYAPFAEILRRALRNGAKNGFEIPDFVLADLLTLTPELRPYYPALPEIPQLEPEAEQRRLFENVVTLCSELSGSAPLLLVIDDAHWADSGSLALMRHLARRIRHKPILLMATYREIEIDEARPFREVLLDLNRERLARRIKLGRLTRDQTESLLAAIFEEEITPEFLEGIFRETEGNPFFIEEVSKSLVESGKLYFENGEWHRTGMDELEIPQSVRETVQSRASGLPEEFQGVLQLASILGRQFDFETLSSASELDEDTLIDALEASVQAQLIEEISGEGGATFSFLHALIPSTLADSVPTLRRRRLHRRAAEAIEAIRPTDFEDLAHHYTEAGDEDRALIYYGEAGRRASAAYANQEAERHFRAALELGPEAEQEADLLSQLGVILARQSHFNEAIDNWLRSAELYADGENGHRIAWCYARMARAGWDAGEPPRGLELAEAGLGAAGEAQDSPELADLLHETARAYFFNGMSEKGIPVAERALSMAKGAEAVRIEAEVLITQGLLMASDPLRLEAAQASYEQAIELAQMHKHPSTEARARNNLSIIVGRAGGNPQSAREHLSRATELARETGAIDMQLFAGAHGALYGILMGVLEQVEGDLSRLHLLVEEVIDLGAGATELRKSKLFLRYARGSVEEAMEGLREIQVEVRESGDHQSLWEVNTYLAQGLIELGELEEPEPYLQEAIEISETGLGEKGGPRFIKSILHSKRGEIEHARGMLKEAEDVYPARTIVFHDLGVSAARAHLAIAESRWEEAWPLFAALVADYDRIGLRHSRAKALREWAEAHISRGDPEDLVRAAELLEEARSEFETMRAPGYVDLIQARLEELDKLGN